MKYLVHIGYPKAASTWLQRNLFSGAIPEIQPLAGGRKGDYIKSGGDVFYDRDRFGVFLGAFHFNADEAKAKIRSGTDVHAKVTVLSNEGWCGHPFSGGVTGKLFGERIHSVVSDATILIIVRNQLDMIVSNYLHYLTKGGGDMSLSLFIRPAKWVQRPSFTLDQFRYTNLIQFYDGLFGRDRVVVVPFELIKRSPYEFVKPICDAVGLSLPTNLSSGAENARNVKQAVAISLAPGLNSRGKFSKVAIKAIESVLSESYARQRRGDMVNYLKHELGDYYDDNNNQLQDRIGYDLAALGYFW